MRASVALSVALGIGTVAMSVSAGEGCYSTGQGPIMSCFEGNRKVTVRKPFLYKDGNYYAYDERDGGYCYRNEHGNTRCIQDWEVKTLRCSESGGGQLNCQ